jgi:hypothetical protein
VSVPKESVRSKSFLPERFAGDAWFISALDVQKSAGPTQFLAINVLHVAILCTSLISEDD